jgi:ribosomal protein S18 acetylase RimI-like enzyme
VELAARLRRAEESDLDACVELWVEACAARDGMAVPGVAERARAKFADAAVWLVAETDARRDGFALVTVPGSGIPADPADAAVLGLLAVAPGAQRRGLARALLRAAMAGARDAGYPRLVLHVLADNPAAVRLYESEGWRPLGAPFEHSLLRRMSQTYLAEPTTHS